MIRSTRGFTLIELMVVMVVMVILVGLGVVRIGNIQAQARDSERQQDIQAIARGLETRYTQGNPIASSDTIKIGYYPGLAEISHAKGEAISSNDVYSDSPVGPFSPAQVTDGYLTRLLPGTNNATFQPPSQTTSDPYAQFKNLCGYYNDTACVNGTLNFQLDKAFHDASGYHDYYVYQPLDSSRNLCISGLCTSFNLYWISEADKTVVNGVPGLKVLKSKHQ